MSFVSDRRITMRRIILGKTWASLALVVGITITTSGFSYGMGKGVGKGKGAAVARVTYNCLGFSEYARKQKSPYSVGADIVTLDVGDQEVMLSGSATAGLVEDEETMALTHMAAASIATEGLAMFSFDTCGTSAKSVFSTVVGGYDKTNPDAFGTTDAEITLVTTARIKMENTGSGGDFSASTATSLQILGFPEQVFNMVRIDNNIIDSHPDVEINVLPDGSYEFKHTGTVWLPVNYGPEVKNNINTALMLIGKVSGQNIKGEGSKVVAGFATIEAQTNLSLEIVSYNPEISLSFVPTQKTGDNLIAEVGEAP